MNKIHKVEKNSLSLLSGKCRDAFEKWLNKRDYKHIKPSPVHNILFSPCREYHFYKLPSSIQYGVMVDFFDSVGIPTVIHEQSQLFRSDKIVTRQEAREEAIKAANNLFNER